MLNPKNAASTAAKTESGNAKPELSNLTVSVPKTGTTNEVDKQTGEVTNKTQEAPVSKKPTIEEILDRMEELEELREKREKVVAHLENLNRFYIDPSGSGCNVKLTDSRGNTIGISHPSVIGEIVHMSKVKMQDELTRIESAFTLNF